MKMLFKKKVSMKPIHLKLKTELRTGVERLKIQRKRNDQIHYSLKPLSKTLKLSESR